MVNHGVPGEDPGRRVTRLLERPRAARARLASPHRYRGWRQWPDDFGRLELERFNVAQFDDVAEAGVDPEFPGLYAHASLWPDAGADLPGRGRLAAGLLKGFYRGPQRYLWWCWGYAWLLVD